MSNGNDHETHDCIGMIVLHYTMGLHYSLLSAEYFFEYDAVARYYTHRYSGARILHLRNKDPENLFAFCFSTPPEDSTGIAHILEHTVLCGSKRFPLKDPFLQLLKGSVHSFLNAMTFPDRTIYPAASAVRRDLFNMMQVYGDAVFSPRLAREMFMQEGHHTVPNAAGELEISGVVYNEMIGASSTHDHVTNEWSYRGLLPDTVYGHSSGGDPHEIPNLDYEAFVDFHRMHYHPSQALIFLYGNIPTRAYLHFLHSRFLRHFRRLDGGMPQIASQKRWDAPRTLTKTFPSTPDADARKNSSVTISWLLNEVCSEFDLIIAGVMSEVLIGNSGCPLYKAILDSPLGEDLSSSSGVESELKQVVFSVGIRGTEERHAPEIKKLIYDTLSDIVKDGVDPVLVQGVLFNLEFSVREIRSLQGLRVLRRAMSGWMYSGDPLKTISLERALGILRVRLVQNTRLIEDFIQEHLLGNAHHLVLTVNPDVAQAERERAELQARLDARKKQMPAQGKEALVEAHRRMTTLQNAPEDARLLALIPRLKVSDMPTQPTRIEYTVRSNGDIPTLNIPQHTNQVAYLTYAIDITHLTPQELNYIPFLTTAITEMGTHTHDYTRLSQLINRHFGGLYASAELHADIRDSAHLRLFLTIRMKTLLGEVADAIPILTDLLTETDFSQHKRYAQVLTEDVNDMKAAIVPSAHMFAGRSASAAINQIGNMQERWSGVSQLKFLRQISADEHLSALDSVYRKVMRGGIAAAAVSAPEEGLDTLHDAVTSTNEALRRGFGDGGATGDGAKTKHENAGAKHENAAEGTTHGATADGVKHANAGEGATNGGAHGGAKNAADVSPTTYTIPSGGNYVACALPATRLSEHTVRDYVAESVLARTLSTGVLWERIRMQGGAYGASASVGLTPGAFCFISYRDPHVARTLTEFEHALDHAAQGKITVEEVEKTVVSIIGTESTPLPPGQKAYTAFARHIAHYTHEFRQQVYRAYLKCSLGDVTAAATRLRELSPSRSVAVIGEAPAIQEAQKRHPNALATTEPLVL